LGGLAKKKRAEARFFLAFDRDLFVHGKPSHPDSASLHG